MESWLTTCWECREEWPLGGGTLDQMTFESPPKAEALWCQDSKSKEEGMAFGWAVVSKRCRGWLPAGLGSQAEKVRFEVVNHAELPKIPQKGKDLIKAT